MEIKAIFNKTKFFLEYIKHIFLNVVIIFKEKNKQFFNKAVKDQTIKLFINKNSPSTSKLFLSNEEFNYRLSWLSIFFSEIQGILLTLLAVIFIYTFYILFLRR